MAEAEAALAAGVPEGDSVQPALIKAQEIVSELLRGLDPEKGGEIAGNLRRLYIFVWERLAQAALLGPGGGQPLAEARQVWGKLSAIWDEVDLPDDGMR